MQSAPEIWDRLTPEERQTFPISSRQSVFTVASRIPSAALPLGDVPLAELDVLSSFHHVGENEHRSLYGRFIEGPAGLGAVEVEGLQGFVDRRRDVVAIFVMLPAHAMRYRGTPFVNCRA